MHVFYFHYIQSNFDHDVLCQTCSSKTWKMTISDVIIHSSWAFLHNSNRSQELSPRLLSVSEFGLNRFSSHRGSEENRFKPDSETEVWPLIAIRSTRSFAEDMSGGGISVPHVIVSPASPIPRLTEACKSHSPLSASPLLLNGAILRRLWHFLPP